MWHRFQHEFWNFFLTDLTENYYADCWDRWGGAPFCMLFVLGSLVKGRQAAETLRLNKTKHTYVGSMTIGRGRVGALALKVESDWSNKPSARNENAAVACCFVLSFDFRAVFPNLVIYHELRDFGVSLRDRNFPSMRSHESPKQRIGRTELKSSVQFKSSLFLANLNWI